MSCKLSLAAIDAVSLILASHLCGLFVWPGTDALRSDFPPVIAVVCALLFCAGWGHYTRRKPLLRELRETLAVVAMACALHIALLLVITGDTHGIRAGMLLWLYAALIVPLGRVTMKLVLLRLRCWQQDVVVIGSGRLAFDAATAISSEPLMGMRVRFFIGVGDAITPPGATRLQLTSDDASALADANVMVALESHYQLERAAWLRALSLHGTANVLLVKDMTGIPLHGTSATYINSHDLMMLSVRDNLSRWHIRVAKRCLDLGGALAIAIVLSPVLAFIAWQVRKDGGTAIYGHPRVGRNGKSFRCWKFRSMVVDANAVLAQILERDPEAREQWARDFKLKDDPRITRIGGFLRRTSLDELPQLWNVIRGEMSLVGPRPIVNAELVRYGDDASYYLMARPGMTGLWQVSGRNDADYPTRVRLDAWYVRNWSLWYDLAILVRTALIVLKRDGAY
ncbi:transmembrane sugar transferase [Caballeronia hypogeia]|uniref:Transmembrane sugar transferase n=1 Tax=Caballeronia hypogeia TaxID=1777140 RepID=A0A158DE83_9BURK|nr:undecaprenyl-phosphate galactose phosphotransferase WbaP [Caballeronia hypogeia]SAK92914.1 transmembrane sugar transferase [Caballeronia hypogeia]